MRNLRLKLWVTLRRAAVAIYAAAACIITHRDASNDVLCMSHAFDDEDVRRGFPVSLSRRPSKTTGWYNAHNAAFERLIFWYVLQVNFLLEQFYCTAAQACANRALGSLEDAGALLALP